MMLLMESIWATKHLLSGGLQTEKSGNMWKVKSKTVTNLLTEYTDTPSNIILQILHILERYAIGMVYWT